MDTVSQAVQIIGSLLILLAFVLLQAKKLPATSTLYLWINFIGASILAVTAVLNWQWGFIILEGVWALVALAGLVQKSYKRRHAA